MYGYVDDKDSSLQTTAGGNFGLNKAFITDFSLSTTAGRDNAPANAILIAVKVGDREYKHRIYEVTGSLLNGDSAPVEKGEEGYDALYKTKTMQDSAYVTHVIKALGFSDDQVKAAIGAPSNFTEFATKVTTLAGAQATYSAKPVDVFLEYQWKISEGQTRTFLQLPKNLKGGFFLNVGTTPTGKWNEVRDNDGMVYKDDSGVTHPFVRNSNFMGGNKANLQDSSNPTESSSEGAAAMQGTTGGTSNW